MRSLVLMSLVAVVASGCSKPIARTTLRSVPSPDGTIEARVVRSGDEGGFGGGTEQEVVLVRRGDGNREGERVLVWRPTHPQSSLNLAWDGPRRLRLTLRGGGSIMDFANVLATQAEGGDSAVSIRLDAPFYGDE